MSEPSSPTGESGTVFRFISDPSHKENLSGRVRAACLTCRRKKIRCSGELNCRTCREKGIVCEGLPERKRPRRASSALVLGAGVGPAGVRRRRKFSTDTKISKSTIPSDTAMPSFSVKETSSSAESDDHNLDGSATTASSPSKDTPDAHTGQGASSNAKANSPSQNKSRPTPKATSSMFTINTWNLRHPDLERTNSTGPDAATSASQSKPKSSLDTKHNPLREATESPTQRTAVDDLEPWLWPIQPPKKSLDTPFTSKEQPSAAQPPHITSPALTESTQQSNHARNPSNTSSVQSRRQTVVFPLALPPDAMEPRYDLMAPNSGAFDDLALLLSSRTPHTGMTPSISDFQAWWDVNGDISALLAQAQNDPRMFEQQQQQHQPQRQLQNPTQAQTQIPTTEMFSNTLSFQPSVQRSFNGNSSDSFYGYSWPQQPR